ncbi:MAG: hypothetical protein IJA09_08160 [Bacteroidales bacterium]|nr:hypothetical protein [Bacteroidales bacterium]
MDVVEQNKVIEKVQEIGNEIEYLTLRILEYDLSIMEKWIDYTEGNLSKGNEIKQILRFIIELRDEIYKLKNELISYRNNIDYSFLSKGIDTYILLSDDGLEIANKSLKRAKEDFGPDYEEDLIKYSYKTRRELVKSLNSNKKEISKSIAIIIYIILLTIGVFLLFF